MWAEALLGKVGTQWLVCVLDGWAQYIAQAPQLPEAQGKGGWTGWGQRQCLERRELNDYSGGDFILLFYPYLSGSDVGPLWAQRLHKGVWRWWSETDFSWSVRRPRLVRVPLAPPLPYRLYLPLSSIPPLIPLPRSPGFRSSLLRYVYDCLRIFLFIHIREIIYYNSHMQPYFARRRDLLRRLTFQRRGPCGQKGVPDWNSMEYMECLTNDGPCSRNFTPCQFLSEEPLAFGTGNRRLHATARMERLATRRGKNVVLPAVVLLWDVWAASCSGGLGLRSYITSPELASMQLPIFNRATSAFHLGFHRCWDPLRTAVGRGIPEQIHASSSPQKGLSHVSMGWLTVGRRTLDETIRLFPDLSSYVPILSIDDILIFKFLLRKVLFLFSSFTSPAYHIHYNPL